MKHNKLASSLAAVSLLLASSTFAADIKFSGFANIVAGTTTSSDETYAGYDDELNFNQGSLFALQASSDLGNGLSVTAQLLSRGRDDWDPKFEWAFLGYEVNEDWKILAGRQRIPFFMYSDFVDVSYAYNWITPPRGVYSLPFDSFDGLGSIYTSQLGEFDSSLHVIFGRNQDEVEFDAGSATVISDIDVQNLIGGAWTLNREWLTLRAAYFQADLTLPVPDLTTLATGFSAFGSAEVGQNLIASEDKVTFAELGFQIDYNEYFLIGEYTKLDLEDTGLADNDSYYITAGMRVNDFTLHLTYGVDDDELDNVINGLPSSIAGAPGVATETAALYSGLYNGAAGYIASSQKDEEYITAGVRWDFHEAAALKFEVTSFRDDNIDANDATVLNIALVTVF